MTEAEHDSTAQRLLTRRNLLWGAAGIAGVAAVGGVGLSLAPGVKRQFGMGPDPYIPDAPEGRVRLERIESAARGRDVDLFTAVPAGYGDGAGLPVVVILHGASATASDFQRFGLARFLTESVRDGAAPFVLAGADGGLTRWEGDGQSDVPQAMLTDELPGWLADRGFDADRRALWGWSMGGYGCLRLAEANPDYARGVAVFSPAISGGGPVFEDAEALAAQPLGIWCGTDDPFYDAIRDFVDDLPQKPAIASFAAGEAHTRVYWNGQTLDAFAFLADHLEES